MDDRIQYHFLCLVLQDCCPDRSLWARSLCTQRKQLFRTISFGWCRLQLSSECTQCCYFFHRICTWRWSSPDLYCLGCPAVKLVWSRSSDRWFHCNVCTLLWSTNLRRRVEKLLEGFPCCMIPISQVWPFKNYFNNVWIIGNVAKTNQWKWTNCPCCNRRIEIKSRYSFTWYDERWKQNWWERLASRID
jgi:hypothetical protein